MNLGPGCMQCPEPWTAPDYYELFLGADAAAGARLYILPVLVGLNAM